MKPYEEIKFPSGYLRWLREDGMYVCRVSEAQMEELKTLHEKDSEKNNEHEKESI